MFSFAVTAPINPPDAKPVLSRDQVWAALQIKVRSPSAFVPVIRSCDVVSDEDNVLTRIVEFEPGRDLPEGRITEVCTSFAPTKVHFVMHNGDEIDNTISHGPSGDDTDLYLTYSYDWKLPEGADPAKQIAMARNAVSGSVATMRKLAEDGKI